MYCGYACCSAIHSGSFGESVPGDGEPAVRCSNMVVRAYTAGDGDRERERENGTWMRASLRGAPSPYQRPPAASETVRAVRPFPSIHMAI
jgi:hypothetical protein